MPQVPLPTGSQLPHQLLRPLPHLTQGREPVTPPDMVGPHYPSQPSPVAALSCSSRQPQPAPAAAPPAGAPAPPPAPPRWPWRCGGQRLSEDTAEIGAGAVQAPHWSWGSLEAHPSGCGCSGCVAAACCADCTHHRHCLGARWQHSRIRMLRGACLLCAVRWPRDSSSAKGRWPGIPTIRSAAIAPMTAGLTSGKPAWRGGQGTWAGAECRAQGLPLESCHL